MLATDKQIKYLCALADKVEKIKAINKSAKVIKANLPEYIDWAKERNKGVTSFGCKHPNNSVQKHYFRLQ